MTVVEAKARLRALDAGLDLAARRIGAGEWLVPSVSLAGAAYTVRRVAGHDGGRWACSCPAGSHGRDCKHQAAIRLLVEREFPLARPR
jgi:hypothetical protein